MGIGGSPLTYGVALDHPPRRMGGGSYAISRRPTTAARATRPPARGDAVRPRNAGPDAASRPYIQHQRRACLLRVWALLDQEGPGVSSNHLVPLVRAAMVAQDDREPIEAICSAFKEIESNPLVSDALRRAILSLELSLYFSGIEPAAHPRQAQVVFDWEGFLDAHPETGPGVGPPQLIPPAIHRALPFRSALARGWTEGTVAPLGDEPDPAQPPRVSALIAELATQIHLEPERGLELAASAGRRLLDEGVLTEQQLGSPFGMATLAEVARSGLTIVLSDVVTSKVLAARERWPSLSVSERGADPEQWSDLTGFGLMTRGVVTSKMEAVMRLWRPVLEELEADPIYGPLLKARARYVEIEYAHAGLPNPADPKRSFEVESLDTISLSFNMLYALEAVGIEVRPELLETLFRVTAALPRRARVEVMRRFGMMMPHNEQVFMVSTPSDAVDLLGVDADPAYRRGVQAFADWCAVRKGADALGRRFCPVMAIDSPDGWSPFGTLSGLILGVAQSNV